MSSQLPPTEIFEKKKEFIAELRKKGERTGKSKRSPQWLKKAEHYNKKFSYHLLGWLLNKGRYVKKPLKPTDIKSILFLRPDAIGDMIVTSPLWRMLKKRNPDLIIGVAGSFRNVDSIRADTDITHIYSFDLADKKATDAEIQNVRKVQYDVVVLCKLDQKARGAALARRCSKKAITATITWDDRIPHHKLFTAIVHLPKPLHNKIRMGERLVYMIEHLFDLDPVTDFERSPSLMIDPHVFDRTKNTINTLYSERKASKHIVFNTQARNDFLEWGYENTLKLAQDITERFPDMLVLLTTSPIREPDLLEWLSKHNANERIMYFPTPDLHELFSIVRLSTMVITPDTSLVHMASAEHKPLLSFYPRYHCDWLPQQIPSYVLLPREDEPVKTIEYQNALDATLDLMNPSSDTVVNRSMHITGRSEF